MPFASTITNGSRKKFSEAADLATIPPSINAQKIQKSVVHRKYSGKKRVIYSQKDVFLA